MTPKCQECNDTGLMYVICSEAGWDLVPCAYCDGSQVA